MTTQEEATLRGITKETETTVMRAICDARSVLAELEGPTTECDKAERAKVTGLIAEAEVLAQFAIELEGVVQRIRLRIGMKTPAPRTSA